MMPGTPALEMREIQKSFAGNVVLSGVTIEARAGDGSTFVRLTDAYLGREGDDYANQVEMNAAVNCLDTVASRI